MCLGSCSGTGRVPASPGTRTSTAQVLSFHAFAHRLLCRQCAREKEPFRGLRRAPGTKIETTGARLLTLPCCAEAAGLARRHRRGAGPPRTIHVLTRWGHHIAGLAEGGSPGKEFSTCAMAYFHRRRIA